MNNINSSYITRITAADSQIKAVAIDGTAIVNEALIRHKLSPVAAAALGRTMMGALLLATNLKKAENKITVRIIGDGPLGGIIVTTTGDYRVRGYVQEPHLELPLNKQGKLDVGGAVGSNGFIHVTKDLQLKEPYTGTIQLATGEIGEDFSHYLYYSEQTPSIVALGVLVDKDQSIRTAGGYMVQLLPGVEEEVIAKLENNINGIEAVTSYMEKGFKVEDILKEVVLQGFTTNISKKEPAMFSCGCSKDNLSRTLISLGKEELTDMLIKQNQVELTCHFCSDVHTFSIQELKTIINQM